MAHVFGRKERYLSYHQFSPVLGTVTRFNKTLYMSKMFQFIFRRNVMPRKFKLHTNCA